MKVSQDRSDWPVDRQWPLDELKTRWNTLSVEVRSNIQRGLLIDWGFAAVEGVTAIDESAPSTLTDEDVKVYSPGPSTRDDFPGPGINVITYEDGVIRHCSSNDVESQGSGEFEVPPLWQRNAGGKLCQENTLW